MTEQQNVQLVVSTQADTAGLDQVGQSIRSMTDELSRMRQAANAAVQGALNPLIAQTGKMIAKFPQIPPAITAVNKSLQGMTISPAKVSTASLDILSKQLTAIQSMPQISSPLKAAALETAQSVKELSNSLTEYETAQHYVRRSAQQFVGEIGNIFKDKFGTSVAEAKNAILAEKRLPSQQTFLGRISKTIAKHLGTEGGAEAIALVEAKRPLGLARDISKPYTQEEMDAIRARAEAGRSILAQSKAFISAQQALTAPLETFLAGKGGALNIADIKNVSASMVNFTDTVSLASPKVDLLKQELALLQDNVQRVSGVSRGAAFDAIAPLAENFGKVVDKVKIAPPAVLAFDDALQQIGKATSPAATLNAITDAQIKLNDAMAATKPGTAAGAADRTRQLQGISAALEVMKQRTLDNIAAEGQYKHVAQANIKVQKGQLGILQSIRGVLRPAEEARRLTMLRSATQGVMIGQSILSRSLRNLSFSLLFLETAQLPILAVASLITIAIGLVIAAITGFIGITRKAIQITQQAARSYNDLYDSMRRLVPTASQTAAAMRFLGDEAIRSGRDVDDLSKAYTVLMDNELFVPETWAAVKALAAGTGKSVAESAQVLARGIGKTSPALQSLTDVGIVYTAQQEKQLGIQGRNAATMDASRKIMEKYGAAQKRYAETTVHSTTIISAAIRGILREFGTLPAMISKGFSKVLASWVTGLYEGFVAIKRFAEGSVMFQQTLADFKSGLEDILPAYKDMARVVGMVFASNMVGVVIPVLRVMAWLFRGWATQVKHLHNTFKGFVTWMKPVWDVFRMLATALKEFNLDVLSQKVKEFFINLPTIMARGLIDSFAGLPFIIQGLLLAAFTVPLAGLLGPFGLALGLGLILAIVGAFELTNNPRTQKAFKEAVESILNSLHSGDIANAALGVISIIGIALVAGLGTLFIKDPVLKLSLVLAMNRALENVAAKDFDEMAGNIISMLKMALFGAMAIWLAPIQIKEAIRQQIFQAGLKAGEGDFTEAADAVVSAFWQAFKTRMGNIAADIIFSVSKGIATAALAFVLSTFLGPIWGPISSIIIGKITQDLAGPDKAALKNTGAQMRDIMYAPMADDRVGLQALMRAEISATATGIYDDTGNKKTAFAQTGTRMSDFITNPLTNNQTGISATIGLAFVWLAGDLLRIVTGQSFALGEVGRNIVSAIITGYQGTETDLMATSMGNVIRALPGRLLSIVYENTIASALLLVGESISHAIISGYRGTEAPLMATHMSNVIRGLPYILIGVVYEGVTYNAFIDVGKAIAGAIVWGFNYALNTGASQGIRDFMTNVGARDTTQGVIGSQVIGPSGGNVIITVDISGNYILDQSTANSLADTIGNQIFNKIRSQVGFSRGF